MVGLGLGGLLVPCRCGTYFRLTDAQGHPSSLRDPVVKRFGYICTKCYDLQERVR